MTHVKEFSENFEEDIDKMLVIDEAPKGRLPIKGKMFNKEYLHHFSAKLKTLYDDI